jgi:ATP-dependent Lon protease
MVSTRSKANPILLNNKKTNPEHSSSDDESDLDFIDNDIDKYKDSSADESDSELKITHSNNIIIDKNLCNKSITRTRTHRKRKRIVDSESDSSYDEYASEYEEVDDNEVSYDGEKINKKKILNIVLNKLKKGFAKTQIKNYESESEEDCYSDSKEIKKYAVLNKWKRKFTKTQNKKYGAEYQLITKKINVVPTINNILQTIMPFDVKCSLVEKLIILNNMQVDTFEHLSTSKSILEVVNKYKNFNLSSDNYKDFDRIEKKLKSNNTLDMPLKFKILKSCMKYSNKMVIYNAYKYFKTLPDDSTEANKLLNWIELVLKLPTELLPVINILNNKLNYKNNVISKFLSDVKYTLDKEIYGMINVKEQILCVLNNKITNPKLIGSSIGLVGPQGVGKTQIIKILSNAIKLPFESISLGGMNDSSFLLGHGYTYEGARCGAIAESLINMKYLNGILFFDEIDKISTTKIGAEITKSLIHITDFTQNSEFCDKYLGNSIKIDISNLWFIYSLNYKELIDKTLLDRLTLIEVSGYTTIEKTEMAIKYLIPSVLKNIGMPKNCISFSNESLILMITKTNAMYDTYTKDSDGNSGVRKLKECITSIITKINYLNNIIKKDGTYGNLTPSFAIKNFKLPYVITEKDIVSLKIFTKNTLNDVNYDMYI